MYKNRCLRVLVPAIQVLLLIAAAAWHQVAWQRLAGPGLPPQYAMAPLDILIKLNFPLLVLWSPVVLPLNFALSTFHLNLPTGPTLVGLTVLFDFLVLSSVAVFWYFVVAEAETRLVRGSSLIGSSSLIVELFKAVAFGGLGVASFVYAYWDGHRLLLLAQNNRSQPYGSNMADAIIGGLFLAIWGIVLIKISVMGLFAALSLFRDHIHQ
jgi:hypothetical protein